MFPRGYCRVAYRGCLASTIRRGRLHRHSSEVLLDSVLPETRRSHHGSGLGPDIRHYRLDHVWMAPRVYGHSQSLLRPASNNAKITLMASEEPGFVRHKP